MTYKSLTVEYIMYTPFSLEYITHTSRTLYRDINTVDFKTKLTC